MKILHVINSVGLGGMQRQMIELIKILSKDGVDNQVLVYDQETFFSQDLINNKVAVTYIKRTLLFPYTSIVKTKFIVDNYKPDIIHIWNIYTIPIIIISRQIWRYKSSVILNGTLREAPIKMQWSKKVIVSLFFKKFNHTLGNAQACIDAFGMNNTDNCNVIKNGFDLNRIPKETSSELRTQLKMSEKTKYICMVSALSVNKDHMTFINAAVTCLENRSDIIFLIVGDGPTRPDIEDYLNSLSNDLSDRILLLGKRKDVEEILKSCDVSVLASASHHGEGISNSIMESLACGTPVVATDNGGTKEIINDGVNGFVVEPVSPDAIASKILLLLDDEQLLARLTKNGTNLIIREYSLRKMGDSFKELYRDLLMN